MSEKHRTDHHVVSYERYCELKAAYHRRARLRAIAVVDFDPDGSSAAHEQGAQGHPSDRRGYDDLELWE